MKISWIFVLFSGGVLTDITLAEGLFTERFHWSPIAYQGLPAATGTLFNETFNKDCSIIQVNPWKDKVFLSLSCMPHYGGNVRFPSLVYVDLNTTEKSPPLKPYPKDEAHLIQSASPIEVDKCDRLWLVANLNSTIFVLDLVQNKIIRQIRVNLTVPEISTIATITIDARKGDCENAYAYLPNYSTGVILVYSYATNTYWLTSSPTFVNKKGEDLQIVHSPDGIYSIAAAPAIADERTLYVQLTSTEYLVTVSAKALQNPQNNKFTVLGLRSPSHRSRVLRYDEKNSILFYEVYEENAIGCWNRKRFPEEFSVNTTHEIPIPGNINITDIPRLQTDDLGNLWLTVGEWVSVKWDYSFYATVYIAKIKELIKGTVCDSV